MRSGKFLPRLLTLFSLGLLILIPTTSCQQAASPDMTNSPLPSATLEAATPTATPTIEPEKNPPLILAHYMPWYQTPQVTGYWGWHWTMNHFDPNKVDANGLQELASYNHPLTGAYDSSDDDILEYQVLLMKLSGIDGVIVDWYGMEPFLDYAVINQSTMKLLDVTQKAGLSFVICYEDQTVRHMVENGHLQDSEIYEHAQDVMRYLQENYFSDASYLRFEDRPVLFIFGPQYFINFADWVTIFSVLETRPQFFTLNGQVGAAADGGYPWPPMEKALNGVLDFDTLKGYLTSFYGNPVQKKYMAASAVPGFHDIYQDAGLAYSYGFLDAQQGETFAATLDLAFNNQPAIVQLVTWNDYGEGTVIEPTAENGYQYLEMVMEKRRVYIDNGFPYGAEDLQLPLRLFNLRKQYAGDEEMQLQLDKVFKAITAGDLETARRILDKIK